MTVTVCCVGVSAAAVLALSAAGPPAGWPPADGRPVGSPVAGLRLTSPLLLLALLRLLAAAACCRVARLAAAVPRRRRSRVAGSGAGTDAARIRALVLGISHDAMKKKENNQNIYILSHSPNSSFVLTGAVCL